MTLPTALAHWKQFGHGKAASVELPAAQMDEMLRAFEVFPPVSEQLLDDLDSASRAMLARHSDRCTVGCECFEEMEHVDAFIDALRSYLNRSP